MRLGGLLLALALAACDGPHSAEDGGCPWPVDSGPPLVCGELEAVCCDAIVCVAGACDVTWTCNDGTRLATSTGCTCEAP